MGVSDNAVRARPDVNNAPVFASETTMRTVMENEEGDAGDPVTADDADGDDALLHDHVAAPTWTSSA